MPRSISIVRRRANLIDLRVEKRPDIIGFRFSAASNFDVAFSAFETVPNGGLQKFAAGTVIPPLPGNQHKGWVRFLFDPDEYTATVAAVKDDTPFFVRLESQNPDGSFNAAEAMHLIQPYNPAPHRGVQLFGTAPSGASLANSLEIQLPMQCNDFEISNDGAADLYVALERPGTEFRVQPATSIFRSFEQIYTTASQIFIRGAGGTTTLNAIFTVRNNPVGL